MFPDNSTNLVAYFGMSRRVDKLWNAPRGNRVSSRSPRESIYSFGDQLG